MGLGPHHARSLLLGEDPTDVVCELLRELEHIDELRFIIRFAVHRLEKECAVILFCHISIKFFYFFLCKWS